MVLFEDGIGSSRQSHYVAKHDEPYSKILLEAATTAPMLVLGFLQTVSNKFCSMLLLRVTRGTPYYAYYLVIAN
ncbi:hypothetical protein TNCV_2859771 [Trichonephila clavipes]|nr:hypothetical protein TNCV_2859771 [Trichonephila clavipes]